MRYVESRFSGLYLSIFKQGILVELVQSLQEGDLVNKIKCIGYIDDRRTEEVERVYRGSPGIRFSSWLERQREEVLLEPSC